MTLSHYRNHIMTPALRRLESALRDRTLHFYRIHGCSMIRALIDEAKSTYAAAGLECGDGLLPPADEASVEAIASSLSLTVPEELRAVYRVHGGQQYIPPGVTGLFGEHRLLAPQEVVDLHRTHAQNYLVCFDPPPAFPPLHDEPGHWVAELIPFASWDAYALCIHAATGEVWEFIPSSGLIRHRPSIAAVLKEIIEVVRAGGEAQLGDWRQV